MQREGRRFESVQLHYFSNMHPAAIEPGELLRQCDVRRQRRGGPGGQHRNKVETAVVLTHRASGIAAEANERRSQAENQQVALARLRLKLALALRTPVAGDAPPSALWRSRVARGRLRVSPSHADFPALLAEAIDRLAAEHYDVAAAANGLRVSSTQLVNLLRKEPAAMNLFNVERLRRDLRSLK